MKPCIVDGCDRTAKTATLCWKHYRSPTPCSVSDCDSPNDARGLCKYHYKQLRRSEGVGAFCTIEGCNRPHEAKGLCSMHYDRLTANGSTELISRLGALSPKWQGINITYAAAHRRNKAAYGVAANYLCIYCACPAEHWAYDYQDPNELLDPKGRPYSADTNHYEPLCKKCHRHEDVRAAASRKLQTI